MTTVVIGGTGLLGSSLVHEFDDVIGTYFQSEPEMDEPFGYLDITQREQAREMLEEEEPELVINAAAMTDVDGCEVNPVRATAVNTVGPTELAEECQERNIEFVQISTDYVFHGELDGPYSEYHSPNPIQTYGETKLDSEIGVLNVHDSALVVRISFLWGWHWNRGRLAGFPQWVLNQRKSNEKVTCFFNQQVTPTRAGFASSAISELVERDTEGIVHLACSSQTTPYEIGNKIIGEDHTEAVYLSDVDRIAARPRNTTLDTKRAQNILGRSFPSFDDDWEELQSQGRIPAQNELEM